MSQVCAFIAVPWSSTSGGGAASEPAPPGPAHTSALSIPPSVRPTPSRRTFGGPLQGTPNSEAFSSNIANSSYAPAGMTFILSRLPVAAATALREATSTPPVAPPAAATVVVGSVGAGSVGGAVGGCVGAGLVVVGIVVVVVVVDVVVV